MKRDMTYLERLKRPSSIVDVVIDTDMYNEIDDLYALAYLILSSDKLNLQGIFAAPFYSPASMGRVRQNQSPKEGMEESYAAILKLLDVMGRTDLKSLVYRGSEKTLTNEKEGVDSAAVQELIRLAKQHTPRNPLYVISIAVLTDIASAILWAPEIVDRIVVIWLGGHGKEWKTCTDFNAIQDIAAARVVFDSGVALVQLPCNGVVSGFCISGIELEYRLKGKGTLCEYLLEETLEFMSQKMQTSNWSKPLWDVAAVAWLLDDEFMEDRYEHSPIFEYDGKCAEDYSRHLIKYVYSINRDRLFDDLFAKLAVETGIDVTNQ